MCRTARGPPHVTLPMDASTACDVNVEGAALALTGMPVIGHSRLFQICNPGRIYAHDSVGNSHILRGARGLFGGQRANNNFDRE